MDKWVFILALCLVQFFFESCSPSKLQSRSETTDQSPPVAASNQLPLPEGWTDITSRSQLPQIHLWLVNIDDSATMVLKELNTSDSELITQSKNDPCFLANISLQLKIADGSNNKRITRTPAVIDSIKNICGYVYSESGLLRRALVFENHGKLFELELFQENIGVPFDVLSSNQLQVVKTLLEK